ncbi:MAG TPA: hypothetical protein PK307_17850 [Spirochaetota bacterium]|nr:hypothetical protein [Spirochaetota bacterium]HOD14621.1 hypothetical protein [Spirochaetota bacterium]HPG51841.1 hypothetical protein [Spirochaetota bacterium]HPN11699.1 hypothetical protein [Spirochaetota bacterium]HQL84067.1 hypothetical protein [Spirochaetota bacterium]
MQPNLENVKKKIQENRDLVSKITARFPGFAGYVEKAETYDADRIVRGLLADRVGSFKATVNEKSSDLARKKERGPLPDLDALSLKMETVIKKCQHADFGKAAALSSMKLSDDDVNRLLEYDWRLITSLDELDKAVGGIGAATPESLGPVIGGISDKLKEFEKKFDERKNVLLEVL